MNNYKNNYSPHINKIIKNVFVVFTDDSIEKYDAIQIKENRILIGRIRSGEFTYFGSIPDHSIKEIYNGFRGEIKDSGIWAFKKN
jgi:hypothetical protein